MKLDLFDYNLPPKLIAQFPHRQRNLSRLLVVDRQAGTISHTSFSKIEEYLSSGDSLVVNNTKVFKARLNGHRPTGGKIELFLTRLEEPDREAWKALVKPSRRAKPGEEISFGKHGTVLLEADLGDGYWLVTFKSRSARERLISACGHVPLPPYISRSDQPTDIRRYQTVYAASDKVGAVAAPTAGFHFTGPLIKRLAERSIPKVELTLHVGPGTFRSISAEDIKDHQVEPEYAELNQPAADFLNRTRKSGGAITAVGTTSVRTLESAVNESGEFLALDRLVDLYIQPGHQFLGVDRLITNFHLPKSSLLVLVSAFAGRELIMEAYHQAIAEEYRFYSYGDAMLIL